MNNLPQQITDRYTRNLLASGRNKTFEIKTITRQYTEADGLCVGTYYDCIVGGNGLSTKNAVGVTPLQALTRCLTKHGVTFR